MEINHLRASTINTYGSCQWDFFLRYVCNYQTPSGKKATLGSIFHLAIELVAKTKKTGHYLLKDKFCDPEYLFEIAWNRYFKEENHIHNFTSKDKEFCKDTFYKIYNSELNPINDKIVDIEKQFEIEIQKPGFKLPNNEYMKLRGTVDLVTEYDSDTLWVKDWKTGKRKDFNSGKDKDIDNLLLDTQLRVYNLAMSKIYPQYKNRLFTLIYVNDGGPFTVSFHSKDLDATLDNIRRKFNEIRSNDDPLRLKDDLNRRSEFWKCKYVCHFGKEKDEFGRSLCDLYYGIYKDFGLEKTQEIITSLSLEGKPIQLSDRNDYGHDRMYRGIIK